VVAEAAEVRLLCAVAMKSVLDELAHDLGLRLGREVDETAVRPEAEVRPELVR